MDTESKNAKTIKAIFTSGMGFKVTIEPMLGQGIEELEKKSRKLMKARGIDVELIIEEDECDSVGI